MYVIGQQWKDGLINFHLSQYDYSDENIKKKKPLYQTCNFWHIEHNLVPLNTGWKWIKEPENAKNQFTFTNLKNNKKSACSRR